MLSRLWEPAFKQLEKDLSLAGFNDGISAPPPAGFNQGAEFVSGVLKKLHQNSSFNPDSFFYLVDLPPKLVSRLSALSGDAYYEWAGKAVFARELQKVFFRLSFSGKD